MGPQAPLEWRTGQAPGAPRNYRQKDGGGEGGDMLTYTSDPPLSTLLFSLWGLPSQESRTRNAMYIIHHLGNVRVSITSKI